MFALGHSAIHGCSKCDKLFPGNIGNRDYSGFDMTTWEMRTTEQRRNQMYEITSCNTARDQYKLQSSYGARFSVLVFQTFFDTTRMTVIDPMHNSFLGSVKNLFKTWKKLRYLNMANLEKIQEKQIVSSYLKTMEKCLGRLLVGLMGSMLTNKKSF